MKALLEVSGLRRGFGGVAALRGVSFSLRHGEILALIGPNGAGKSTCFNLIGGQLRPDGGQVWLDGDEITGLPAPALARRGLARSFQLGAAFTSMSVLENVQTACAAAAGTYWRGWRPAGTTHRQAATDLLAQVGLAHRAGDAAAALTHGEIKRLELAMCLAGAPRLLLLDEPTAGMSAAERTAIVALIRAVAAARSLAVLFTEHDMDIVFGIAQRVIVLAQGMVLANGTPAEIRADPAVRAVYLGGGDDDGGGSRA